jgi:hypothetical protein
MCRPRWWFVLLLAVIPFPGWCEEPAGEDVYALLKEGSFARLAEECSKKGLSGEGDTADLRRRLLADEISKNMLPFSERAEMSEEGDIVLHHADFIEYGESEASEELIFLSGSVDISFRDKKISADEVRINTDAGIITGKGNIVFVDEYGKRYIAAEFFYDTQPDEGIFFEGKTSLKKFIYSGDTIRKIHETDKFVSDHVSLSTCNLKDPHYRVAAEKLYYYDSDYILIKNASFYYGQDPLIELPYYYRNLEEPDVKSSIYFRERAGLVLQNTYYPIKSDERQLALKGDLYERLGFMLGADFRTDYPLGETELKSSLALANDVYYYDDVTENWSPYGPPGSTDYSVTSYLRYRAGAYQKFEYGDAWDNSTELNLYWASDPYYEYDFERRTEQFDLFKLIQQAESDSPRTDNGFAWYANHYSVIDNFRLSVLNTMNFKPQRDTEVDTVYLPSYYQYRIYTITAPNVTLSHSDTVLEGIQPEIFSGLDYASYANYNHTAYYNAGGILESEVHRASTHVNFGKDYELLDWLIFSPVVEAGAEGQRHVDPDTGEQSDDSSRTLVYGKTSETLQVGPSDVNMKISHTLKYKLFGPDDFYEYGRFRIHELGLRGYAGFWKLTDEAYTSYDIRPVFDWQSKAYDPYIGDPDRFSPLINTLTFTPIKTLSVSDRFVYDIANSRPKTNSFILNYNSDDIYLQKHLFNVDWELDWEHNFIDPLLDVLHSTFEVDMVFHRYLTLYFSVYSRNENVWRYFPSIASDRGVETVNPVVDLLRSFNFFNVEDRKSSNFKLKSISVGLIRDLHDWQLKFDYTGNRELSYDGSRYLWNNTFSVSIGLKEVEDMDIHTTFSDSR